MKYVTRIAPSPSGHFHIGTARTAYFNWLAARASGGSFILRIDDTNAAKSHDPFVDVIYQAMGYLNLDFDKTFRQSDRSARYADVAAQMLAAGTAVVDQGAIRLQSTLKTPSVKDLALGSIDLTAQNQDIINGMVLVRADGAATYHFANVIDDIDFGVNLVIRGSDHISNVSRQVAIYDALGAAAPVYSHLGLLCDLKTGKKLSKSDGSPSLLDYRDQGVDADAMCNFLLRMGWGPKVDDKSTAVLPRDRALHLFLDGGNMRAISSKVDFAKLDSFNRKYRAQKRQPAG